MKQWKDMTKWEKFGLISLIIYLWIGAYTVMYNITVWTYQFTEWILDKRTELEGYLAGRKAGEKTNQEV